ncbi:hypothetical protein [Hazenella coriacea]|uniref:Uncharacterized protein n=1 Tax=Hazenella coriacea TaxID=1179467 RepID=A0A4R3L4R3_9BACL|nr:hypothetical protein [Hazenella coriacea]TCS93945.1 hypothetical protein EDD58_105156 [Hazenella coriacea]
MNPYENEAWEYDFNPDLEIEQYPPYPVYPNLPPYPINYPYPNPGYVPYPPFQPIFFPPPGRGYRRRRYY